MSGIRVASGLVVPIEVVVEKTAILAKSGAGKSNTGKVIVEGVLDAGAQVVILDPVGHWWGLRSQFSIPVLGGMNGDVPLDPLAGKLIAEVAVESGQSMVLDVSLMDSDGEMQRFAYEFAERLYKLKQLQPSALLIVLEEADEFAPQDTRGANVPRMVGAWNRIAKRGRGRGLGLLSITLRSAALSKNVLNQTDRLIAMRTTAPLDLGAIEDWVKYHRADGADAVIPSLPGLKTGEAWIWHPEEGVLERVHIVKARSLDTSATPKVGAKPAARKKLKPIDLAALGEKIAEVAEKAKADDPAELRKRLKAALAELNKRGEEAAAWQAKAQETVEVTTIVEVPVLTDQDRELLAGVATTIGESFTRAEQASSSLVELLSEIPARIDAAGTTKEEGWSRSQSTPRVAQPARGSEASPVASLAAVPVAAAPSPDGATLGARSASSTPRVDGDLPLGAAKLLTVLAQFPAGRTRKQLAVLAGYKASGSTFRGAIAELRKRGYATPASVEPIVATPQGLDAAPVDALPTGRALYDHWRRELPEGARKVLDVLYESWPNGVERDELAERVGYEAKGSTFRGALAALRNVDLITRAGVEPIKATDELMETAA